MPKIQDVLTSAGTAPTDFTLHDAQHGFRVAQRMIEIVPAGVQGRLSIFELSLLLLAAYLHDIGMSPTQARLDSYRDYILSGEPGKLTSEQIGYLHRWLDGNEDEMEIPLAPARPTPDISRQANLLLSHFCRDQHVAWCDEWIDSHLGSQEMGAYVQWVTDLKLLCRSHHMGYDDLVHGDFEPKSVGRGGVVHLRYLAVVLRVADVLEFDPERTPDIVFRHRDITPGSEIFWRKDHHVTLRLDGQQFVLFAQPPNARTHNAIERMVDDIDAELGLARRLDDEGKLSKELFRSEPLPHRWTLMSTVQRRIRPLEGRYEYIDGVFRPDTKKVLKLLSGIQLYGKALVGVRELVQNAIDAVRELSAYERLKKSSPGDSKWERILAESHSVRLALSEKEGRIWLACEDDGAGMSKDIIARYFLVSGNTRQPELRELARDCESAGITFQRTGCFGIGVLSYFMLADLVEIRTRRTQLAKYPDPSGWYFETEGIGSFGELRRDSRVQGTEVRLRLKPESFAVMEVRSQGRLRAIAEEIAQYLKETLRFLPCEVSLAVAGDEKPLLALGPDWTLDHHMWLLRNVDKRVEELRDMLQAPPKRSPDLRQLQRRLATLKDRILNGAKPEVLEGELPNGMGHFRVHLDYFQTAFGCLPCFLWNDDDQNRERLTQIGLDWFYRPRDALLMSWRGIGVQPSKENRRSATYDVRTEFQAIGLVEIDWRNEQAGGLSISRETIQLADAGIQSIRWLNLEILRVLDEKANKENEPSSAILHRAVVDIVRARSINEPRSFEKRFWLCTRGDKRVTGWNQVDYPAVDCALLDRPYADAHFSYAGRPVTRLESLRFQHPRNNSEATWTSFDLSRSKADEEQNWGYHPDRLVCLPDKVRLSFTLLWEREPQQRQPPYMGGFRTSFPSEWHDVALVEVHHHVASSSQSSSGSVTVWNANHPVASVTDLETRCWAQKLFAGDRGPGGQRHEILRTRERAAAWLCMLISRDSTEIWNSLQEGEHGFLQDVWTHVFGPDLNQRRILCLTEDIRDTNLSSYGIDICSSTHAFNEILEKIPQPGRDWMLSLES
jgi:hypothetical protein